MEHSSLLYDVRGKGVELSTKQASKLTGADDIRPTTMMIMRRIMMMMVMMVIIIFTKNVRHTNVMIITSKLVLTNTSLLKP